MSRQDERWPEGFGGVVSGWTSLLPEAAAALRLPNRDPSLTPSDGLSGTLELIEVRAFTESMGRVESFLQSMAGLMTDAGTLVLDVENRQSTRQLRTVLEGRPGSLDPSDSPSDPSQSLPLRRILAAASAAGLHVEDCYRVYSDRNEFDPGFAETMYREGFLPTDWLKGPPPWKYWLVCCNKPTLAGSVLIGAGDPAAQLHTERSLESFLPRDWEVVRCGGERESVGFNRGVARARGDLLWFLRAGAEADTVLFRNLVACSVIGPAAPGDLGGLAHPGDVSGLIASRSEVLLAGTISEGIANDQVAYEEWCMRMYAHSAEPTGVPGGFATPPPAVNDPQCFAAECDEMLGGWRSLTNERSPKARAGTTSDGDGTEEPEVPWRGRQPRISLCMITRDESEFLGECLKRAAPAVDEIVLVDTGSNDDTVAIAESFGARVLHQPWEDDFSAPRNLAIREATGDWILVLDADEFLTETATERIRRAVEDPTVSGFHMRFTNVYTGGKTIGVMMVRLFRNLPGLRYANYIHEQVTPSLVRIGAESGLTLSLADIEVIHHGYSDEVMTSRTKNERNLRLFEKQLAEHPDDVYSLYKYGDFLRRVPGRGRDARDVLERCLALILDAPPAEPRTLPYAGEVAALCALEHARDEQPQEAQEIVDIALRRFMATPNLHYIAAGLALAAQRNGEAIEHYRRCLAYRDQVLVVPIQEGITSHVSITGIAQAYMQAGDLTRAERLLGQSKTLHPDYEVTHLALSRLHVMRQDLATGLSVLTDYLADYPDSIGACQQALSILRNLGLQEQARRMGEHALRLMQENCMECEAEQMKETLAALA